MRYIAHIPGKTEINGTPWDLTEEFDLAGVRRRIGEDLVEWPGMPDRIFTGTEYDSAGMRAELAITKTADLVVTVVVQVVFTGFDGASPSGTLYIEPVLFSQIENRIAEMREDIRTNQTGGSMKVLMVYSEETKQMFYWNDLKIDSVSRLPNYVDKTRFGSNKISRADLKKTAEEEQE